MAINLTQPIPLPTLSALVNEFTDPVAIANCPDPMRRVSMVMAALSEVEAKSLEAQVQSIQADTELMAGTNELLRWLNDTNSRLKSKTDEQGEWIIHDIPADDPALNPDWKTSNLYCNEIKARYVAAGVDPATLSISYLPSDIAGVPTALPEDRKWRITMLKKNMDAATKNVQLHIDDLSSMTQQKQLFMQTLMGKLNGTYEVATAALKKMAEMIEAVMQNLKK